MDLSEYAKKLEDLQIEEGKLERFDEAYRKGYRFSDARIYALYDVYWLKVSGYYLIQQRSRFRQHNRKLEIKNMNGPFPIEILEKASEEWHADQRCLDILIERIQRTFVSKSHKSIIGEQRTQLWP